MGVKHRATRVKVLRMPGHEEKKRELRRGSVMNEMKSAEGKPRAEMPRAKKPRCRGKSGHRTDSARRPAHSMLPPVLHQRMETSRVVQKRRSTGKLKHYRLSLNNRQHILQLCLLHSLSSFHLHPRKRPIRSNNHLRTHPCSHPPFHRHSHLRKRRRRQLSH